MNDDFEVQAPGTEVATLDQSNGDEFPPMIEAEIVDREIRRFCLINAGTLVINTPTKGGDPKTVIGMARDFYLFMVGEDPVVDPSEFDQGYEQSVIDTNVIKVDFKH